MTTLKYNRKKKNEMIKLILIWLTRNSVKVIEPFTQNLYVYFIFYVYYVYIALNHFLDALLVFHVFHSIRMRRAMEIKFTPINRVLGFYVCDIVSHWNDCVRKCFPVKFNFSSNRWWLKVFTISTHCGWKKNTYIYTSIHKVYM